MSAARTGTPPDHPTRVTKFFLDSYFGFEIISGSLHLWSCFFSVRKIGDILGDVTTIWLRERLFRCVNHVVHKRLSIVTRLPKMYWLYSFHWGSLVARSVVVRRLHLMFSDVLLYCRLDVNKTL